MKLSIFSAENKAEISSLGAIKYLQLLANYPSERISPQARRALRNLDYSMGK